MVQLSFGLRDYTDDIIKPWWLWLAWSFLSLFSFFVVGIVVSESHETLALMKAFGYTNRECQVIFSLPIVSGPIWFVLGTVYQYAIMVMLIGVIKDTVPEKIEHHFDGNVCFWTLIGFAFWSMKASFIYQQKTSKANHQRSALSRINRREWDRNR